MNGEKQIQSVTARTPVEARKTIRVEYGAEAHILTVREEKRKQEVREYQKSWGIKV